MKKRKTLIVFFILLLASALMIFIFSAQNGEKSADVSQFFTEKFLKIFHMKDVSFAKTEHLLRKAAHFIEFFILGAMLCLFLSAFFRSYAARGLISFGLSFLYAIADEWHQYFIPNRSASLKDVFLDGMGALCGVFFVLLIRWILSLGKKRREADRNGFSQQGTAIDKKEKI